MNRATLLRAVTGDRPAPRLFLTVTLLGCAHGACSCGGANDAASDDGGRAGAGGAGAAGGAGGQGGGDLPPAICRKDTRPWAAGEKSMVEKTAEWGLLDAKAEGIRLSAVDFDHDGWVDLMVRRGGDGADNFNPGGVRHSWLLRNTGAGRFEDVTQSSGIRTARLDADPMKGRPGELFAFGDVDNDGDLDVYQGRLTNDGSGAQGETSELLLNDGKGHFTLGPESNPFRILKPLVDVPLGASFVDFDRDGNLDLWVTHNSSKAGAPQQAHLYRGDGKGGFVDVTAERGMVTKAWSSASLADLDAGLGHSNSWSAVACDLNGDGNPELLSSSYGRAPNHLWQATGPGDGFKYVNRSVDSGYAFDGNQDWHDNESARCWCKLHPTAQDCGGVPAPTYIACTKDSDAFRWGHAQDRHAFRLGGNSGGTVCADVNNDGVLDLVTTEIAHWDVGKNSDVSELLLGQGGTDVRFMRLGNDATGLARTYAQKTGWNEGIMNASVFDFDNDGWPDAYLGGSDYPGQRGFFFHQDRPGHFEAVPLADGIDQHRSHGVAVADFDHDGDLDVVVGHSRNRCETDPETACYPTTQIRLFENQSGSHGNFVQLELVGATAGAGGDGGGANRAAIGARVSVKAGGVTQTHEVGGGYGQLGMQDDLVQHFGLGAACDAAITVRWPDARLATQTFSVTAGHLFRVEQGKAPTTVR